MLKEFLRNFEDTIWQRFFSSISYRSLADFLAHELSLSF